MCLGIEQECINIILLSHNFNWFVNISKGVKISFLAIVLPVYQNSAKSAFVINPHLLEKHWENFNKQRLCTDNAVLEMKIWIYWSKSNSWIHFICIYLP